METPSQFEEIHEVISRYKTLVSMHRDLMQSAQEGQEKIERAKARLARYMEEKDDEILQHNNELARLQMRFDRARSDVIIWVSTGGGGRGVAWRGVTGAVAGGVAWGVAWGTHPRLCAHTCSPPGPTPTPGISLGSHPEHRRQEDPLARHH